MKIKILAFGIAKDILQTQSLDLVLDSGVTTVNALKEMLKQQYPEFQKLRSLSIAVNEEYQSDDFELNENDEIVIIPPVSGG